MGNFTNISAQLKTVLQSVQQAGHPALVDVLENPSNQFTGLPSATIVPADVQSSYATVKQNRRIYSFEVAIYVSIANTGDMSAEFAIMRDLVDGVLDALEKTNTPSGVGTMGSIIDYLQPVPMRWTVGQTGSGDALIAPIHVMCQKDIDLF